MNKDKGHLVIANDLDNEIALHVERVHKSFLLPHNRQNSLKGVIINLVSRGDRAYEVQEVLKDISFDVKKGEFFGIVGRNGSGKSTLLKMLAGIYTPSKGKIIVNGTLTPFIELGVGFNPELTGRENVYLNGALLGFSESEVEAMYGDIMEFAELERFMDQKLKNYSSGMQVRLAFSIAIRAKSDILLIDEVLAVGDAAFQQKCYAYFEYLKEEAKTVVLVTHDMSAVERFCSRAMLIDGGKILSIGEPRVVADAYREENITVAKTAKSSSGKYKLLIDIANQEDTVKKITFTHTYSKANDVYVGFTLLKDGINVAEVNSSAQKNVRKNKVSYYLDTTMLNPGTYHVSAAIFTRKTHSFVAISSDKKAFVVQGSDPTRGGAMKLAQTWAE